MADDGILVSIHEMLRGHPQMLTLASSPLITRLQIIALLFMAIQIAFLFIGNWKVVPWIYYYVPINSTCTDPDSCAWVFVNPSLWDNCLLGVTYDADFNFVTCPSSTPGLVTFIQTLFILSAICVVGAFIVGLFPFYALFCRIRVKISLLISAILQVCCFVFATICWTVTFSTSQPFEFLGAGMKVMIAYWVFSVFAAALVLTSFVLRTENDTLSPSTIPLSDVDTLFVTSIFFASAAAICSWGTITIAYTPDFQDGVAIIVLLLNTLVAMVMIYSITTLSSRVLTLKIVRIAHFAILPLEIAVLALFSVSIQNKVSDASILGYAIAQIVFSTVSLATTWMALNLVLEGHSPFEPNSLNVPKSVHDLQISAVFFIFFSVCLAAPVILLSAGYENLNVSMVDANQFFSTAYLILCTCSFIMALISLVSGVAVRKSTAVLASWVLMLFAFASSIIVSGTSTVQPSFQINFSIPAVFTSFIGMTCMAIFWSKIRLLDNHRFGNVCSWFGEKCCKDDVYNDSPCSRKGGCCFFVNGFGIVPMDNFDPSSCSCCCVPDEDKDKALNKDPVSPKHSKTADGPVSRLSSLASIPSPIDDELVILKRDLEIARLEKEINSIRQKRMEIEKT